jgi:hypothetical protein
LLEGFGPDTIGESGGVSNVGGPIAVAKKEGKAFAFPSSVASKRSGAVIDAAAFTA